MRAKPLQTDDASRTSGEGTPLKRTRDLKHRVLDEVINFLGIALYLWVTFGVFAIHEWVVSAKDHIDYHFYGFALVNALVLGKVMLVADDLHFADWFKNRPLIYPILCKAVAFSILFLVFDVVEEVIVGVIRGKTIGESIPNDRRRKSSRSVFCGDHPCCRLDPVLRLQGGRPSDRRARIACPDVHRPAQSRCISVGNAPRGPLIHAA